MKRLSNQQLIEKIFQRINSEAELSAAISSSELSDLAKQLILDMQFGRVIEQGKIFKVKGIGK